MLELVKALVVLVMLSYAAVEDLRKREVPNWLWQLAAIPAALFFLYELYSVFDEPLKMVYLGLVVAFSIMFLMLLYDIGWLGGADTKGLLILALFYPHFLGHNLFLALVIYLALILSLPLCLYHLIRKGTRIKSNHFIPFFPFLLAGFVLSLFLFSTMGEVL